MPQICNPICYCNIFQITDGRNASPVPLDLSAQIQNFQIAKCSDHGSLPLELFCEQCSNFICRQCTHMLHKEHTTVDSLQKIKEEQTKLNSFLDRWKKKAKKAKKWAKELENCINSIETSSSKEFDKMQGQYNRVTKELETACDNEMKKIIEFRNEEIDRLNGDRNRLIQFYQSYEKNYESGRRLLRQTTEECTFIDEVKAFMTQNPLPVKVRPDAMKMLRWVVYREPSCQQTVVHGDLSKHLRQHALGFFIPCQPQQGKTSTESIGPLWRRRI